MSAPVRWMRCVNFPDVIVEVCPGPTNCNHVGHLDYGGHVVCSLVQPRHRSLIEAAPELLACLKEAVAAWDLADENDDSDPNDGEALAAWKAVIAKAEGR